MSLTRPDRRWHEHDPEELISSVEKCIDEAVKKFETQGHSRQQIIAVGITNQRETTVVWDKTTGKALYNAIVWTDTRNVDIVRRLKGRIGAGELTQRCGLPLSTYSSVGRLLWLLENVPRVNEAYEKGNLAFGTVDSWLVYKLNGGTSRNIHVSDASNASRTMFMNIHTLDYDTELIDWFRVDRNKVALPKIVRSADAEAYGSFANGSLRGTKIMACLGDQSAALVGQKGFKPGLAKNTYGTGCFLLYNVGDKPVISSHGLLSTVAFDFGEGKTMYALEGSIAVAGSSVKFLVDNFGFIDSSSKLSALAETVEDNGGCTFVTAFSGLFAPYWIDDARGTIFGITAYTQRGHIARATLEATCFQTKAILDAMAKDSGKQLAELAVDGGMCNADLIMQVSQPKLFLRVVELVPAIVKFCTDTIVVSQQTQSDLIGIPVHRPAMRETTALGAAIAAGFAAGVWESFDDLKNVNTEDSTIFKPQISAEDASKRFKTWEKAVQMSKGWSG